jgi:hypothetical protein
MNLLVTAAAAAASSVALPSPSLATPLPKNSDGRACLSNNAAERGLRGIALGRKSWLFCGSGGADNARRPCTA